MTLFALFVDKTETQLTYILVMYIREVILRAFSDLICMPCG